MTVFVYFQLNLTCFFGLQKLTRKITIRLHSPSSVHVCAVYFLDICGADTAEIAAARTYYCSF
jgi:hypothetical protein